MANFVHLRVHSAYSLAEGAIKVKALPQLCQQHNQPAIAITDTNNLFGALESALLCTSSGIQPIIGCELSVQFVDTTGPLVLLVASAQGYTNLLDIVSYLYLGAPSEQGKPYVPFEYLESRAEGLIALTGGVEGIWGQLEAKNLNAEEKDKTHEADIFLNRLKESFPDHLYVEIQRHGTLAEQELEDIFIEKAYTHTLPLVATNNVYFPDPSYFEAHDALLCIASGSYVVQDDRRRVTPHHYFKSPAEMTELFKDIPEAIQNTIHIAKRCRFMPTVHSPILPRFDSENGRSEEEELVFQAQEGLEKRLQEEVFARFIDSEQEQTRKLYQDRLDYEIGIIKHMGFCGYFLIVADFIKWAKGQGIPVGPGRGSGAGSLVAWSLTITDMDPIQFTLIFERFLNPERVSMPDFDVDFCQDRRDEVIRYVQQKYGNDRVAHIITFGKLQARAVLRDVGRVLQIPYPVVDRICKMVPNNPASPVNLEQAIEMEPAIRQACDDDEAIAKMVEIGKKLEGLYRHASTHAAGVVISDRSLTTLVPLFKDESSALPATQFNMKYVELAGLVKFDFLGLKTLSIIEHASQIVRDSITNPLPDFIIQTIPLDDAKTFELLCNVNVVGVFQLESAGMRDVLRKLRPDRFEDLIALVALYRPGPMDDIPRYLACKHGQEAVTFLNPSLEPILAPTYGVMVYQEQVMQIAQVLGGYTLGAADMLRRAMGKKIKSEMDAQREQFVNGAIERGAKPQIASQIFDQMAKFAGYGFNKSHSAPYALLAYQTAYLKANYPVAFFAASMTADMHNTDKINAYHQDMIRMGMTLLPPDINHSFANFTAEGGAVRFGLGALKNVGGQVIDAITQVRGDEPFSTMTNFIERATASHLSKRLLENLIGAGAFDCLEPNRRALYEAIEHISYIASKKANGAKSAQRSLFGGSVDNAIVFKLPDVPKWDGLTSLQKEFDSLGFYLSDHPLNAYKQQIEQLQLTPSSMFATISNGNIRVAGVLLNTTVRTGKKGQKYAFLSLSDQEGTYEVTLFSEIYSQSIDLLKEGNLLAIEVLIKKDNEQLRLTANKIYNLNDLQPFTSISLKVNNDKSIKGLLDEIQALPAGSCEVLLELSPDAIGIPATVSLGKYAINTHVYHQLMAWCG
jgi:DNA polymerase-3 subunit alpha